MGESRLVPQHACIPLTRILRTCEPSRACGGGQWLVSSPNSPLFYAHHAFVDKLYRDWEQASPANVFSGASLDTIMEPWARTASRVLSDVSPCVLYASDGTFARSAAAPLSADLARKAEADGEAAARLLGASEAQIRKARATVADILRRRGIALVPTNGTAA
jgi:Common central domain of tyrosinase